MLCVHVWSALGDDMLSTLYQILFILCTQDRKLCAITIYDVYIMYWAFDEHLKPCCFNGCLHSQMKKSAYTDLLHVHVALGKQVTHVSTSLCVA